MTKRRRGHGEGSIYQRDDGTWSAQVNIGIVGGKRKRRTVSGTTRKEVVEKLRHLQKDIERGATTNTNETVEQFLERWLKDVASTKVRPKTLDNYRWVAQKFIIPALGHIKLNRLGAQDVQRLLTSMAAEYSAGTIANVRQMLGTALETAERWSLVSRNVVRLTDAPRGTKRKGQALTVEQALHLLATAAGERYELAYTLAIYCGLRRGELCGLQWGDLNLPGAVLTVQRSMVEIRGKTIMGETKTETSRRTIPLPVTVMAAIERHATLFRAEFGEPKPDQFLFYVRADRSLRPRDLQVAFQRLRKRAGLEHVHLHDLRHTAASLMARAGVPMHVAQRILGHSSIKMTAEIYTHLIGTEKAEAAAAMDALLGVPILEKK